MCRIIHISSSLLLTNRSLGIQQACFYGTAHVQSVLLIVLTQHVPHNGQCSCSPYINNVNKVKSLNNFNCPSVHKWNCPPHVCNVFGLLRWLDSWTTGHMTMFLHKQLNTDQFNALPIGTAVGNSFLSPYFYLCFKFESLIGHQNMLHSWYHWDISYIVSPHYILSFYM